MPWRSSSRWTWTAHTFLPYSQRVMRGLWDDGLLKFIKNHISLTLVKMESGLTIPPYESILYEGSEQMLKHCSRISQIWLSFHLALLDTFFRSPVFS